MKNLFTEPKIAKFPIESGKRWFVWFRFNNENPIRIYKGINTLSNYSERLAEAQLIADIALIKLKQGWVPDGSKTILQKKRLVECFNDALENIKVRLSKNTYDNYKSTVNMFIDAMECLKYDRVLADSFTRTHAKQCLDHIKNKRSWSNTSYNKGLKYVSAVFHEVIEAEQSDINPFREIKNLKVSKTEMHIPPTDAEMTLICDQLQSKNYGFYIFYLIIYHCGIRPKEIRLLKIKDLLFDEKMIKVPCEVAKNGNFRYVPMLGNIPELLKEYESLDPELYIFGVWMQRGGKHSQDNWFLPNEFNLKEDTPSRQWKKLIKEDLGLNLTLYSAKHKGAIDKLNAGMSIETICGIFGHSEKKVTEIYLGNRHKDIMQEAMSVKSKLF